jgi:hypothetical protein
VQLRRIAAIAARVGMIMSGVMVDGTAAPIVASTTASSGSNGGAGMPARPYSAEAVAYRGRPVGR